MEPFYRKKSIHNIYPICKLSKYLCVFAYNQLSNTIFIFFLSYFRDIRERQAKKANAANSLTKPKGTTSSKNATISKTGQSTITYATVEQLSSHRCKDSTSIRNDKRTQEILKTSNSTGNTISNLIR